MTFASISIFLLIAIWRIMSTNGAFQDFFPNTSQNLTRITWAHAVNNQSYLNETLKNDGINMIEADIVLGTVNGSGPIPIMGHPPVNTSDLSLESFLRQVTDFNNKTSNATRKGVKLDFKSTEVFNKSIDIVTNFSTSAFPIWINADILRGPINATTEPVNATVFLQGAKSFPNSILSIGWTTEYGKNFSGSYTESQINEMKDTITKNNVNQEITFPVRAGLAARSKDILVNLTDFIPNSTLTIWSSENDNVDVEDLRELIKAIGLNKTYVDVPIDLLEQLHLDKLTGGGSMTKMTVGLLVMSVLIAFLSM